MAVIEDFRRALKYILDKQGRGSEKELAGKTGISAAHINKFKNGKGGASEDFFQTVSHALGYTFEEMVNMGASLEDTVNESGMRYASNIKTIEQFTLGRKSIFVEKSVLDEIPGFDSCIEILNRLTKHKDKKPLIKQVLRDFLMPYLENDKKKEGGNNACG